MQLTNYDPYEKGFREERLSYEEVNAQLYGESAGTTSYSPEITHYTSGYEATTQSIERLTNDPDITDLTLGEAQGSLRKAFDEKGWSWKEQDYNDLNSAEDRLQFLESAANIFEACQGKVDSEDPREAFIAAVVQDVLVENEFEDYFADHSSLSLTVSIMERYAQRLQEIVATDNWPEFLDAHRQTFVAAMNTPKLRQMIGKEARQRMALIAEQTPIIITDPLTALIAKQQR